MIDFEQQALEEEWNAYHDYMAEAYGAEARAIRLCRRRVST
jgi:hypothetical protein